jgi:hypothetical protein
MCMNGVGGVGRRTFILGFLRWVQRTNAVITLCDFIRFMSSIDLKGQDQSLCFEKWTTFTLKAAKVFCSLSVCWFEAVGISSVIHEIRYSFLIKEKIFSASKRSSQCDSNPPRSCDEAIQYRFLIINSKLNSYNNNDCFD